MTSYVMVPAHIVKQACLNFIKSEEEYGKARVEEMIQEEIENNWLWWKRPMTREEVIKSLNKDRWNYWMYYSHDSQIYDKERVVGLLALANLGGPISLCAEDAILVDNYKELK